MQIQVHEKFLLSINSTFLPAVHTTHKTVRADIPPTSAGIDPDNVLLAIAL
jgi:hypothetical protein